MNWKKILRSTMCLVVVLAILLNCVPTKAEAVAIETTVAVGVVACLILMSVGVVFNPKTQEDLVAIGHDFQTYMYQWGTSAEKLDEVEEWFGGLTLLDPSGGDDEWSPNKTKIRLAKGLLAGITSWIASIVLNYKPIVDASITTTPQGFVNFRGVSCESAAYWSWDDYFNNCNFPFYDFLKYCGLCDYALPIALKSSGNAYMFYFDESGCLRLGYFVGLFESGLASNFSLVPVSDCLPYLVETEGRVTVFFSEEMAKSYSDYESIECYVLDWETLCSNNYIDGTNQLQLSVYKKNKNSLILSSVSESIAFYFYSGSSGYWVGSQNKYLLTAWEGVFADGAISQPDTVPGSEAEKLKYGNISEEELPLYDLNYGTLLPDPAAPLESVQDLGSMLVAGTLTLDEYLSLGQAADPGAVEPVWIQDIPLGSAVEYEQNAVADPVEVLASVDDGGTITYEWHRYDTDTEGNVYPVDAIQTGPVFVPSTEEVGTSYYHCVAYNTSPSGLVSFRVASNMLAVTVVPSSTVDPNPGTDPDTNPDSIGQLDSETFWEKLPSVFTQPLESLGNSILNGIKEIFVPSQDYLSSKVDALTAEFGFIGPVVTAARSIVLPFNDFEPEPPVIYLHLEDTRGSYDLGGTVPFIDMTWYAEYKPIGDALLSSLLWVVFVWRLFRQLPGLIAGLPGDFVYDSLQGLHINLPSRSMDREVQKVKTRMEIAKNAKKGAGK